jgi:Ca-activated chloride channel family protein
MRQPLVRRSLPIVAVCGAVIAFSDWPAGDGGLAAQVKVASQPAWRAQVDLVSVPATITDASGRLVTGLSRDAFKVFEDGVEQPITQFVGERVPVSLGIVLDVSESMTGQRMADARFALKRFVNDLLDAEDEALLMVFNHRPRLVAPWTLKPSGGTAIYDAIVEALPLFRRRAHQRAAIVVISDGADTASDRDVKTVRERLRRDDAFVYAIAIDAPGRRPVSGQVDPYALRGFTDESGGYTEVVHDSAELVPATARIAEELNNQYLLGYVAPRPVLGEYRSIRVRVTDASYRVRARRGYVTEPRS